MARVIYHRGARRILPLRMIAGHGAASESGAAIAARLRKDAGATVVGVDLRNADVVATCPPPPVAPRRSQGTNARRRLGSTASSPAPDSGPDVADHAAIASVNYFGAQVLLERAPAAAGTRRSRRRAISVELHHDPRCGIAAGRSLASAATRPRSARWRRPCPGRPSTPGRNWQLTRWLRRVAPTPNGRARVSASTPVAAGPVQTRCCRAASDHPIFGPAIRGFPVPTGVAQPR